MKKQSKEKDTEIQETGTCSLCGGPYQRWGNNPQPLRELHERCCDTCNSVLVIPARIRRISAAR